MSSRDEQWWDLQAAEYVLGSLSEEDRAVFAQLIKTDPDVQRRVREWESRLDPLHQSTQAVEPSPQLFDKIMARIASDSTAGEPRAAESELVPLTLWREHVRFWQTATAASIAAAATIIGFLIFSPMQLLPRNVPPVADIQFSTVSVLESEAGDPVWVINYRSLKTEADDQEVGGDQSVGELVVSVVGQLPLESDQSHQLWMVLSDGSGVQSVGLLPDNPGESKILSLPLDLSDADQFAASVEVFGGVPGPEHGPVVAINPIVLPADSI